MFRAIASLLLFGALSPVSTSSPSSELSPLIDVASLPQEKRLMVDEKFSASGAIVIDVESGKELFSLAPDQPRSMGSIAKLVTAIVIYESHDLDEVVTVPRGVENIEGNVAGLQPGERYTVADLLGALLVASANDAAYTLALYHSTDIAGFADAMNERSQALGLLQTHFDNPIGFDSALQASTPRELAWLSLFVWKNDHLRSLVSKRTFTMREYDGERHISLRSTNQLLSTHPSFFFGLKTGTTDHAGQCIVSLAQAHGREYILVILRSSDRYRDTLQLFHSLTQNRA